MTAQIEHTSARLYQGLWGILARWFRVPVEPPALPGAPGDAISTFRPDPSWLRYLQFRFWIGIAFAILVIFANSLAVLIAEFSVGVVVFLAEVLFTIVPAVVAFVALHLRYDSTWYVMSDRSLRIRRGIWVIHETTITYENIQNVSVNQGPLQRFFGIADVLVQTAGGGGGQQQPGQPAGGTHSGLIEGIKDAPRIRDVLASRMRHSRSAGLGDEHHEHDHDAWSPQQIDLLRDIRDVAQSLAAAGRH
ncbi:MAG: PH domain-containing protein [Planctomycetaceae bacterium]|nr:PH domain-containing protein [Planctomycetaceae bacterium]